MRESDFKYILSVLQGEDTKSKPTDWYSILGFLEFHRVAVYFYNRALELGIALPEQIAKKLYESYDEQKMICQKKSKYIELISSALEKSHVNYAFLKGSVLQDRNFQQLSNEYFSSRRYPQHYKIYKQGERNSNDIDILVSQKNLFKIGEVLRGLGFQQGRYDYKSGKFIAFSRQEILTRRMNRGETAPYVLVTGDPLLPFVEVDLNFSLDIDSQNLKDILKTPVIDACFTAYLHRDKNHLSVLGADSLLYAGVDETDGRAFKIKSLFEDTKIKVSVSENQRLNFWRFFAPFIISNLLSAARGKNFYALYKNDEERKIIDLCAEETVALAAEENVRLEHAEILVSLYNIPSGYVSPLQNAPSPKTADILSSLLGSPGKNRRAQAPTLYALLREIYNKY